MTDGVLLNGTAPVNTCIGAKQQWIKTLHMVGRPRHTSIMTMAKEKMSDSLLCGPSFKTSGAVHLAVWTF